LECEDSERNSFVERRLKQKAPLAKSDSMQPDKIAVKIASCDAALAKLNANSGAREHQAQEE